MQEESTFRSATAVLRYLQLTATTQDQDLYLGTGSRAVVAVEDATFYYLFYSRTLHLFRTLHYIISRTLFLGHFNYLKFLGHLIDDLGKKLACARFSRAIRRTAYKNTVWTSERTSERTSRQINSE